MILLKINSRRIGLLAEVYVGDGHLLLNLDHDRTKNDTYISVVVNVGLPYPNTLPLYNSSSTRT